MNNCFWCWYRKNAYVFNVPGVCTVYWTEADWAKIMHPPLIQLRLTSAAGFMYATRARNERGHTLYSLPAYLTALQSA